MSAAVDISGERKSVEFRVETRATGDERTIRFIASTGSRDRDGDTISPRGIRTNRYAGNPVFQPFHDYKHLPTGRSTGWGVDGDQFWVDVYFPTKEELGYESEADMPEQVKMLFAVYRFYKAKMLNAVSIGFAPVPGKVEARGDGGFHFDEVELLEISAVPVPSNYEALAVMRESEDFGVLKSWARKVLDDDITKVGQTLNAQNRSRARAAFREIVALMRSGGMEPEKELERMDEKAVTPTDTKDAMTDEPQEPTTKMHEDLAAEIRGILDAQERRVKMLRGMMDDEEKGVDAPAVVARMCASADRLRGLFGQGAAMAPDDEELRGLPQILEEYRDGEMSLERAADLARAVIDGFAEGEPAAEKEDEPQDTKDAPLGDEGAESVTGPDAGRDITVRFPA